jgi:hypothetical protein
MLLFEDSWKRIERAVIHAKAFVVEFHRLFPKDGYTVRLDQESPGTFVATAFFNIDSAKNDLALELGEFFYQLRGALDAAIWQTVTICEGSEPTDTTPGVNRLEFPITSEANFEKAAVHKFKFPDKLKSWIRSIQTDSAEKPSDDPDLGLNVTLETIHNFARKDRHRRLHVAAIVPRAFEYIFDCTPSNVQIVSVEFIECDFLKGNNKFARFELESINGQPITHAELTTGLAIDVAVDGMDIWSQDGFAGELIRCGAAVEYILNRFESTFNQGAVV